MVLAWANGLAVSPVQAVPDEGITKNVWRLQYGVTAVQMIDPGWLSDDADADGMTNEEEIGAGTNPFIGGSVVQITKVTDGGTTVSVTFPSIEGKAYTVQGSAGLTGFLAVGAVASGSGIPMTLERNKGTYKFFRVLVSDVDTDGDTLSDWVEKLTGRNPNSPTSVDGLADFPFVTGQLALPSQTVNIMASEPFASEDGPTAGKFTVTRTQKLLAIEVPLNKAGTAVAGVDYAAMPSSVSFAAGDDSVDVFVNPTTDSPTPVVEGSKSVTATLQPPPGPPSLFVLGENEAATVIIGDSTAATGTGLLGRYYDTASTTYANAQNFGRTGTYVFTRGTSTTTGNIVVTVGAGLIAGLQVGHQVRIEFTSGNAAIDNVTFDNQLYTVGAVTATTFTVPITSVSAFTITTTNGNCNFSIQTVPQPAVVTRVDPTVNFDWAYGTPNDVSLTPTTVVDNYSTTYEGYLSPTTAGSYRFQLDADDKARVLIDLTGDGDFVDAGEEVVEHGWDTIDGNATPEVAGTFKIGAANALVVPAGAAQRYKIRVEHAETLDSARCRLQWSRDGGAFANIPSTNLFTHATGSTYASSGGTVTVTTPVAHNLGTGNLATLWFSAGALVGQATNYSGAYPVVATPDSTTFTVTIAGAPTQAAGSAVQWGNSASATAGMIQSVYANTSFSGGAGSVTVQAAGPNQNNNGIFGAGTPDSTLIGKDTFTARWTGQLQPQFSEEYTFVVQTQTDDGLALWINGQPQVLKMSPSANTAGSTYVYDGATGNAVVTYSALVVPASGYAVGEIVRLDPASGSLQHAPVTSPTYSYDSVTGLAVVDFTNLTNVLVNGFLVGQSVELDPTSGNLTTLVNTPYTITAATATTFTVNVGAGLFVTGTGNITIADTRNGVITAATATTFTVNFGLNKYANGSGSMSLDIVNKPLKDWSVTANERYVRIPMIGGARYNIQLDYYENTSAARCLLSWFSPSQPKQIIPQERLYPESVPQAPPAHVADTTATALIGGPFSYAVLGSNAGIVSVSGLPPGLSYNPLTGLISGTASAAGDHQILITITNAAGTSTSVLNLDVEAAGGNVAREVWTVIAGTSISSIPVSTTPASTSNLTSLEAPVDAADNFGARMRGYITAPTTGNYYFWLNASDSAEFWLSNDDETISSFKRATVTGGVSAKSPWMALEQGKRYYFEILHKAGVGSDNLSLGWSKPGEPTTTASEVVPGYVITNYVPPAPGSTPGTLYIATMLSQNGAITNGVGSSTLRLSEDENTAIMNYSYTGLTGPITSQHIHTDAYLNKASTIVYDIDTPVTPGDGLQPDGSHKWTILPVGTLTKADIIEIIKQGKAYINLHTGTYPNGEIRGNYTLANGTRTFTPPPAPPVWTDDSDTDVGAVRFLTQATFGPNIADITALKAIEPSGGKTRYELWIEDQFTKAASHQLPEVIRTENANAQGGAFEETLTFNAWWWNSIGGQDQLRQRMAFALSEIHVVSAQGPLDNNAPALSAFYDRLADNAFGNFRTILETTTKTWTMGRYLDMWRNDKPDLSVGRSPNENYAREIKQLFSVGLYRMWPDGTLILTSKDSPIDTYTQREIVGFAHVFTGWDYGYTGPYRTALNAPGNFTGLMREVPARHFTGVKRVLNNEVLPGLPTLGGVPLDPYAVHNASHYDQPVYQALPEQELDVAHEQLFQHPNVGPFICRQLIQRMVTSHPSRDYLYRVAQKFNDDGTGVRGNMQAVIKAILLDYEARSNEPTTGANSKPTYGKQREPVLRVAAAARAFRPTTWSGTYSQTDAVSANTRVITIDTSAPHKLIAGNSVFLDFTSSTPAGVAPFIGSYNVSTVVDSDTFTVTANGWATGTFNIPANSTTCTVTMNNHWLQNGHKVYVDFTSGGVTVDGVADLDRKVYTLTSATAEVTPTGQTGTFTFETTTPASGSARSGNMMIPRFSPGSYVTSNLTAAEITANPGFTHRITLDTNTDHHLTVGNQVQVNFYAGNPQPPDMVGTVFEVVDLNTYTVLANGLVGNESDNSVYQFPLVSQPLNRSGNVGNRGSTYNMGNTDTAIDQTPINSGTVFNFYLPDYKFPGTLASQGITTPEFQETAETSVIRQANFLFEGIYYPTNNVGLASFKTGSNALVMDLSQWIGNATNGGLGAGDAITKPWTDDTNVDKLIDKLSTLLLANQLSADAKTVIQNHVLTLTRGRQISSLANNSPTSTFTTVNTGIAHNFSNGNSITISGVTGGTFTGNINATHVISNVTTTSFRVPIPYLNSTGISVTNARASNTTPYDNVGTAPDGDKRDRLNAVIQLILTSPDFTIQR
jgi:uncharacterized protein (DUF1800 family)